MDDFRENLFKIKDIDCAEKPLKIVKEKPYIAIFACMIAGIIIPIVYRPLWMLSIIMVVPAMIIMIKVPNRLEVVFYDKYVIIYTRSDNVFCQKVFYDEIEQWVLKQGKASGDLLSLKLLDGKCIYANVFNSMSIVKMFNKIMPDREANFIRKEQSEGVLSLFFKKRKKG